MADAFETIGDWVNDARGWFAERITVAEWVDGFEEWLQENADTIFTWITEKLSWLVEALETGFLEGEPPVVALFFVVIAFGFALGALGHPISTMRAVMVSLVALPAVLWAHDGETQVALIAATVALVAVMARDQEEALDPLVRTAVIFAPAAAIVLRGNLLVDDPPSFDYPPLLIAAIVALSLAGLLVVGVRSDARPGSFVIPGAVIVGMLAAMVGSVPLVGLVAVPAGGIVLALLLAAWNRGGTEQDLVLAVPTVLTLVAAVLTTDEVVAGVAVALALATVAVALVQWRFRGVVSGFPLDGLYLAALSSLFYLWGDLEVMAAVSAGLMVPLVVALAVVRPTAGRTFPTVHVLRSLVGVAVGLVVVEAVARLARLVYDNVEFGDAPFRLEVLRPLAATTEFWESAEFLKTAGAVGAGALLVVLLVWLLGVGSVHAVALAGVAVAGFLLDDPLYMAVALAALAWEVRSFKFGLMAGIGFVLIDTMNLWEEAMETLSLVLVAALIAICIGVPIGVAATQSTFVSRLVRPVLDLMQTMPALVYLIPTVVFFRIGVVPGVVSTVIFAMPPAVRLTELGIRQVDEEVVEAGEAFGTPPSRILSRIQIPLAMPTIMAGVNQVIMLSLSMVVLAAFVGAGGLGAIVVRGMSRQDTGLGVQAGLAVVVLAIFLDRVTQALGQKTGPTAGRADAS